MISTQQIQILTELTTREDAHEPARVAGFDLQNLSQGRVAAQGLQMEPHHDPELGHRVVESGDLFLESTDESTENVIENAQQQVLFAFEIEIESAVSHLGLFGHVGHPSREVTLDGEDFGRGTEDFLVFELAGCETARRTTVRHEASWARTVTGRDE